jgi:hypothetical protein
MLQDGRENDDDDDDDDEGLLTSGLCAVNGSLHARAKCT